MQVKYKDGNLAFEAMLLKSKTSNFYPQQFIGPLCLFKVYSFLKEMCGILESKTSSKSQY